MVVSLVYNMVDTFFIAQTGNTDLAAALLFQWMQKEKGSVF